MLVGWLNYAQNSVKTREAEHAKTEMQATHAEQIDHLANSHDVEVSALRDAHAQISAQMQVWFVFVSFMCELRTLDPRP